MKKSIGTLLLIAIAIFAWWFVDHNFTFNFVALYVVLIGIMIYLVFTKEHKRVNYEDGSVDYLRSDFDSKVLYRGKPIIISNLSILIFGFLAIYTFSNYVNPDKNVFYNYDHHAIKVEGVKVDEGFMVAGNNGQAFIDNSTINGKIYIKSLEDDKVVLQLDGVTAPIYVRKYKENGAPLNDSCINAKNLFCPDQSKSDKNYRATFVSQVSDEGDNVSKLELEIKECHRAPSLLKRGKDSAIYFFGDGDKQEISGFDRFLKSGYELQAIAQDAFTKMDLSGVNIIRPVIFRNLKQKEVESKYGNNDYLIELEKQNTIRSIAVNGVDFISVESKLRDSYKVSIPYGEAFYIGSGEDASVSVLFEKLDTVKYGCSDIAIKYEMPRYQMLSSTNRGKETSIMVTSSIINAQDNAEDAGLINNITDNLALFDLFENHGNKMNISPFFISYISDLSSVEMQFRVLTNDGSAVANGVLAGQPLSNIKSQDGEHEWLVSIENFKDTTPFTATRLVWVLFVVVLCSLWSVYFSSRNNLYTSLECAAHLMVIAYLTVKFFLLWRTTVFSPVTSISLYEFNHFRDVNWINSIYIGLGIFYFVLFVVKALIIWPINEDRLEQMQIMRRYAEAVPTVKSKLLLGAGIIVSILSLAAMAFFDAYSVIAVLVLLCGMSAIFVVLYSALPRRVFSVTAVVGAITLCSIILLVFFAGESTRMLLLMVACLMLLIWFVRYLMFIVPQKRWAILMAVASVLIAVAYVIFERVLNMPMFRVLGGAVIYFAVDWFIYKVFGEGYVDSHINVVEGYRSDKTAVSLSIWNMICMSGATLLADGGYGIMFTLFMIFALWAKVVDISNHEDESSRFYRWESVISKISLVIVLFIVVFLYKRIFVELYDAIAGGYKYQFVFGAVVVLLIVAALVMWALNIVNIRDIKEHRLTKSQIFSALGVVVTLFVAAGILTYQGVIDDFAGGHTEYRIRAHMEKVGDVLENIEEVDEQNRFLQASLNDWILYEYKNIGDEIVTFGEGGNGYFKLQPQSKIGAMWFAQTTDICLSRYIIAEHGMKLAVLFVASFFLFFVIAIQCWATNRWTRIIVIQVSLLFAVQSLMIFLANTRAFIFFGQDFPMISITSRVSALYFMILMTICVVMALIGKHHHNILICEADYRSTAIDIMISNRNHRNGILWIILMFCLSAIILYSTGIYDENAKGYDYRKTVKSEGNDAVDQMSLNDVAYYNNGVYDVEVLMARVKHDLDNHITPVLKQYQRSLKHKVTLKRDMSAFMKEFSEYDSLQIALGECSKITNTMFKSYVKSGSKHNSLKNMICLRNVRSTDYKKRGEGYKVVYYDTLEFTTGSSALNYYMPYRRRSLWTGSVVEDVKKTCVDSVYMYSKGVAFIPARLTNGEDVQLVSTDAAKSLVVLGSDGIIALNAGGVNVVNVGSSDYVISGNQGNIGNLPLKAQNYFAKNILINGTRTFIYPHGHKMFWARNIASEIVSQRKHMFEETGKVLPNNNIELTINSELTASLYDVYKKNLQGYSNSKNAADRAVIVADGDGNVRAMVDYRLQDRYRLNPNDHSRIAKVSDSLYLNFEKGRASETRYFGNFARNVLRRGPGSTQKPIVWTAVTSMYNTGWWKDLKLVSPEDITIDSKHTTVLDQGKRKYKIYDLYAGKPIERAFRSIYSDEHNNGEILDIQWYMYKSSNYYNSIMAFLGSYSKKDYEVGGFKDASKDHDGKTLFYYSNRTDMPQKVSEDSLMKWFKAEKSLFPQMRIASEFGNKNVSFNKFLTSEMAKDTESLLLLGLSLNFELPIYKDKDAEHPMLSSTYFNMAVRQGRTRDRELNEYMVRSVAIGNNTAWSVSPFDMAEMYGRLATLNRSYNLSLYTLDKDDEKNKNRERYTQFDIDDSWKFSEYLDTRNELLKGMSLVYSSKGTASDVDVDKTYNVNGVSFDVKIDDGKDVKTTKPTLYIYGKTGTINGYWNGVDKDDHMLVTIITDTKLSQCKGAADLEKVKYYVVYQVDYEYYGNGSWTKVDGDIIKKVIESEQFMEYMGLIK